MGIFALPVTNRLTSFFTFNPKRLAYNPINGTFNSGFELVESFNYLAYEVLNDNQDHSSDVLSLEDMKKKGLL